MCLLYYIIWFIIVYILYAVQRTLRLDLYFPSPKRAHYILSIPRIIYYIMGTYILLCYNRAADESRAHAEFVFDDLNKNTIII